MFLNANTATRRFRELQFDLQALLQAFTEIRPINEESSDYPYVEICWADGSTDIVPVFETIKELSETYVPEIDKIGYLSDILTISGNTMVPSSTDVSDPNYYLGIALFLRDFGLSANVLNVKGSGPVMLITDSHIRNLVADVVTLPANARVIGLDTENVYSVASMTQHTKVSNTLNARNCIVESLDARGLRLSTILQYPSVRVDASQLEVLSGIDGEMRANGFALSGMMRLTATPTSQLQERVVQNHTVVSVEVPVKILGGYRYMATEPVPVPDRISDSFDADSVPSLVTIYPFMEVRGYSGMTDIRIVLNTPTYEDDGKIIQVSNLCDHSLRVCNAWSLGSSGDEGVVVPLNYKLLPPYSTVDFMIRYDLGGTGIRVYMLPMLYEGLHG